MKIKFKLVDDIGIATISGRLDASNSDEFKKSFSSYIEKTANFVLDCSQLDFIDSTGLGAIISILKTSTEHSGDILITSLQDKPKMLFEITRAYKIFAVYKDVETAVNAFKKGTNKK